MKAIKRRELQRWLRTNGWAYQQQNGGHIHYVKDGHKVTVKAHGPDFTQRELGLTFKILERAGFDRASVLATL